MIQPWSMLKISLLDTLPYIGQPKLEIWILSNFWRKITYKSNVNAKTNGGYTPLHISCQFGHQDVFNVLIRMYRADHSIRDNSGKTARQYFICDWNLKARTKRNNATLVGTTKALIKFKRQISK